MDHPSGSKHRGLGATKLPKLPMKKNLITPSTDDENQEKTETEKVKTERTNKTQHEYTDDIDHLPYSASYIDDTTDNKPYLNRRTDSEVLFGVLEEDKQRQTTEKSTATDIPTVAVIDESTKSSVHDYGKQFTSKLGVNVNDDTIWSKSVHGREKKGFDTKAKKSNIPPISDRDRIGLPTEKKRSAFATTDSDMMKNKSFMKRQIWTMLSPTDNRLSMKLFGSRKGIQKEKRRLKAAGNLIIHPCSKFR